VKIFLLVYDRTAGKVLQQHEYRPDQRADALRDRAALELEQRLRPEIEVVVLAADSLDALKRTHGRYFKTLDELSKPAAR
jgi:hypothetical protein